jgi:hypothetical protein
VPCFLFMRLSYCSAKSKNIDQNFYLQKPPCPLQLVNIDRPATTYSGFYFSWDKSSRALKGVVTCLKSKAFLIHSPPAPIPKSL